MSQKNIEDKSENQSSIEQERWARLIRSLLGTAFILLHVFAIFFFVCLVQNYATSANVGPTPTKISSSIPSLNATEYFDSGELPEEQEMELFALAQFNLNKQQYKEAAFYFRKVIKQYRQKHGSVLQGSKSQSGSNESAENAFLNDPILKKAYRELINALVLSQQFEEAMRYLEEATQISSDGSFHYMLGSLYQMFNNQTRAINWYKKAIQVNPRLTAAHYSLGKVFMKAGKNKLALGSFIKVIQIDFYYIDAHLSIGEIFLQDKKYKQAVKLFQKAVQIGENSAEAHFGLGRALFLQKRYKQTIKPFTKTIQLNPNIKTAYHMLGSAYMKNQEFGVAIDNFKKELQNHPNSTVSLYMIGFSYYKQGQTFNARKYYKKVLKLDPLHLQANWMMGIIFDEEMEFDAALKYFRKAVQINPKFAEGYFSLAQTLRKTEKYNEAISNLLKAIDFNPMFTDAQYALGQNYNSLQKYEESRKAYEKVLKIKPNDPVWSSKVLCNLGSLAFSQKGDEEEAILYFCKAHKADRSQDGPLKKMAVLIEPWFQSPNLASKVKFLEKIMKFDPKNALVASYLKDFKGKLAKQT